VSERTRSAYDRWAPRYDAEPNPHTLLEHAPVLEAVAPSQQDSILDAGCGTGRYSAVFAELGAAVTGADFSEPMLAVARERVPAAKFVQVDLERPLPFGNAVFDKVNCAQTLKHLPDLVRPMRELARVLRPNGRFIFSVTHPDMDWEGYEARVSPSFNLAEESDIHHHTWNTYLAALESTGFGDIHVVDVRVSETIEHLLTPKSFRRVVGRPQILLCTSVRDG
jgi:SAM-dependent methyltransferase